MTLTRLVSFVQELTQMHSSKSAISIHCGKSMVSLTCLWYFSCSVSFVLRINSYIQPFTNDFPHADIHELLAPDLLHQIIKGAYKDHLVTWVEKYLLRTHGKMQANIILDDIDRRCVYAPSF